MGQLEGQRVLVLGGTSGMGLATAELAAAEGATVVITGRDRGRLDAAIERVSARGTVPAIGDELSIEDRAAVAAWIARHAPLDHLVLPGSMVIPLPYEEVTEDNARSAFESKFWGPFWAVFDARPHLRRGGSVVLFSGVAAERPVAGYVVGAAIDGAIDAATRSLALELGPQGVRVNTISPGAVHTPLWDRLHTPDEVAALTRRYEERLPLGRVGTSEEGGHAALFLMTNGFVTGDIVALEGGARAMV